MLNSYSRCRWVLLTALLTLGACATNATTPPDTEGSLVVRADVSGTTVAMVVVVVTGPGITNPLTFNLTVSGGVASGTLTLPAGSARLITMHAYDAGGTETHQGAVTINVTSGTNGQVTLVLDALTGQAPISVTLGSITIVVSPSPATVAPGNTVTLNATVTGANGNPIPGAAVTWATSNPGIATVANGVVTGVAAGSTTVVATYQGFAGSGTVNVGP